MEDLIVVHAGLEPGVSNLNQMSPRILMNIRTWDGEGSDLKNVQNPPWYQIVKTNKMVIFGHWAKKGLVNLKGFKGLDTGCVYGKLLTGYCPEEDRFYQVKSQKAYSKI